MKVCLISVPSHFLINDLNYINLGILYISTYLKIHGVEDVQVIDLATGDSIPKIEADIIGISSTTPQFPIAIEVLNILKKHNPAATYVIGGPHATCNPRSCFDVGFDTVIRGEGERAMLKLVNEVDFKLHEYRGHGLILEEPFLENIDFLPDRESLDMSRYNYYLQGKRATNIMTSRGCPFSCAFCLPQGTRIITSDSPNKKIEEVKEGDRLIGYNEGSLVETTVTEVMKRRTNELYKIALEDGKTLMATGEHPVFTTKGWLEAKSLEVGNEVLIIEPRDKISFNKKLYNPAKREKSREKASSTLRTKWHNYLSESMKRKWKEGKLKPQKHSRTFKLSQSKRMTENNPMKSPEIAKKCGSTLKELIERGKFTPYMCTDEGREDIRKRARERALTDNPMWDAESQRKRLESWKEYYIPEKHPLWKGGMSIEYPSDFSEELKEKVKELHGFICKECNITEEECKKIFGFRLDIHHLDHDKKNTKIENLIPLCRGCHFKRHWKEWKDCPHFVKVKKIDRISYNGIVYNFECEPYDNYFANYVLIHNCCKTWGRTVRFVDPHIVAMEMQLLRDEYGFEAAVFFDDAMNYNLDRLRKICKLIKPLGMTWRCLLRAKPLNSNILREMRESGCVEIQIGAESGSDKILRTINKGTTVKDNLKAIKLIKEAGISQKPLLMIGNPGESRETVEETRRFLRQVKEIDLDAEFDLMMFTPYPLSDIWENPEKYDIQFDKEHMDFGKAVYKQPDPSNPDTCLVRTSHLSTEELIALQKSIIDEFEEWGVKLARGGK